MIYQVTGTVLVVAPDHTVIDLHGLALRVATPPLPLELGETTTLHTHLIVRENALDLYGFLSAQGRWLFEQLLTVPKVGPKTALQLVSKADEQAIINAIASDDVVTFKQATGTGGKTAEQILRSLSETMQHLVAPESQTAPAASVSAIQTDAIAALMSLGFTEREATERVAAVPESDRVEELITQALRQ